MSTWNTIKQEMIQIAVLNMTQKVADLQEWQERKGTCKSILIKTTKIIANI